MIKRTLLASLVFAIFAFPSHAQDWNVLVASYDKTVKTNQFKDLGNVFLKKDGNIYRYYIKAKDQNEANSIKEKAVAAGFKYARVEDFVAKAAACKKSCIECQNLHNIFFDFAMANLRSDARKDLEILADVMGMYPAYTVEFSAHTDAKGDAESNQKLSERRAAAAQSYLMAKGVSASRIKTSTHGEEKPIAKNELPNGADTEQGRQFNRRVEIHIFDAIGKRVNEVVEEIKVPEPLMVDK